MSLFSAIRPSMLDETGCKIDKLVNKEDTEAGRAVGYNVGHKAYVSKRSFKQNHFRVFLPYVSPDVSSHLHSIQSLKDKDEEYYPTIKALEDERSCLR